MNVLPACNFLPVFNTLKSIDIKKYIELIAAMRWRYASPAEKLKRWAVAHRSIG